MSGASALAASLALALAAILPAGAILGFLLVTATSASPVFLALVGANVIGAVAKIVEAIVEELFRTAIIVDFRRLTGLGRIRFATLLQLLRLAGPMVFLVPASATVALSSRLPGTVPDRNNIVAGVARLSVFRLALAAVAPFLVAVRLLLRHFVGFRPGHLE